MQLIFIRHGITTFNEQGIFQGQYDCKLSKTGLEMTKRFKQNFNIHYDYCYSSPLKRASMTAQIITDDKNIIYDDRLMEICFGEFEKTKITEDKLYSFDTGINFPIGAETKKEVEKRVSNFLNYLKNKYSDDKTILIITHGGIIRAVQRIYNLEDVLVNNLEVFKINI